MVPAEEGILPSQPGNPAALLVCAKPDICTDALFLPVNNAARIGAQIAHVWKLVYRSPFAAKESNVGVGINPPNAEDAPYPTSSNNIHTTFGAPLGAVTGDAQYSCDSANVLPILP